MPLAAQDTSTDSVCAVGTVTRGRRVEAAESCSSSDELLPACPQSLGGGESHDIVCTDSYSLCAALHPLQKAWPTRSSRSGNASVQLAASGTTRLRPLRTSLYNQVHLACSSRTSLDPIRHTKERSRLQERSDLVPSPNSIHSGPSVNKSPEQVRRSPVTGS